MKIQFILFTLLFSVIFVACDQSARRNPTAPVEELNEEVAGGIEWTVAADAEFLQDAFRYNRMLIRYGNLAKEEAESQEVREFAAKSVEYHLKLNGEIEEIAEDMEITLPAVLGQEVQRYLQEMEEMEGEAFDKTYVRLVNDIQLKEVIRYEEAEQFASLDVIRDWASEKLPELKSHELALDEVRDKVLEFPHTN